MADQIEWAESSISNDEMESSTSLSSESSATWHLPLSITMKERNLSFRRAQKVCFAQDVETATPPCNDAITHALERTELSSCETVGEAVEEEVRNAIANEMKRILASSNYEYPEPPIAPRKRLYIFPLWIRVSVSISVLFFIGAVCRELMISLL